MTKRPEARGQREDPAPATTPRRSRLQCKTARHGASKWQRVGRTNCNPVRLGFHMRRRHALVFQNSDASAARACLPPAERRQTGKLWDITGPDMLALFLRHHKVKAQRPDSSAASPQRGLESCISTVSTLRASSGWRTNGSRFAQPPRCTSELQRSTPHRARR